MRMAPWKGHPALGVGSGLGKANLLLALLAAEVAEDDLPVHERRRPRRVHRATRVQAVMEIPKMAELVQCISRHPLETVLQILDAITGDQGAIAPIVCVPVGRSSTRSAPPILER